MIPYVLVSLNEVMITSLTSAMTASDFMSQSIIYCSIHNIILNTFLNTTMLR